MRLAYRLTRMPASRNRSARVRRLAAQRLLRGIRCALAIGRSPPPVPTSDLPRCDLLAAAAMPLTRQAGQ